MRSRNLYCGFGKSDGVGEVKQIVFPNGGADFGAFGLVGEEAADLRGEGADIARRN